MNDIDMEEASSDEDLSGWNALEEKELLGYVEEVRRVMKQVFKDDKTAKNTMEHITSKRSMRIVVGHASLNKTHVAVDTKSCKKELHSTVLSSSRTTVLNVHVSHQAI